MEESPLTVTILNKQLESHIRKGPFKNIYVKGEISNLFTAKSGHAYFSLKDEGSTIECVAFQRVLRKTIRPKNGLNVIIKGSLEVYKQKGKYQLKVNNIKEDGLGQLFEKLQLLKEDLEREGLFSEEHKREIPAIPKRIGVITSKTGAAIKDIKTTIERRWPYCTIYIFHSLVQGTEAPENLIRQLRRADRFGMDTLIIGRGGGSVEDLWAFNDEKLAREVYSCRTPIISAVGHERDVTLIDYVSDKRAATPTAAAEMAVPNIKDFKNKYESLKIRLKNGLNRIIGDNRQRLDFVERSNVIRNPFSLYENERMRFDTSVYKIKNSSHKIHESQRNHLNNLVKSLEYYSKTLNIEKRTELNSIKKDLKYISKNLQSHKRAELNNLVTKFNYLSGNLQNDKRKELDNLVTKFNYLSRNLQNSKRNELNFLTKEFRSVSNKLIFTKKTHLQSVKNSRILKNPQKILNPKWQQYIVLFEKVEVINPLNSLKRGYSIVKKGDKTVSSAGDLKKDDVVKVQFKDGDVNTKVI